MRSGRVSMPVRIRNALNGDSAGPRSRSPSTRQAMAKAKLPKSLLQLDAVIFGARLAQHRVFVVFRPVEGAGVDDDAAERIAVAAEKIWSANAPRCRRRDRWGGSDRASPACLSTISGTPALRATAAMASISVTLPEGLAIDSMKIALVCGVTGAPQNCRCRRGRPTPRFQPKLLKAWVN